MADLKPLRPHLLACGAPLGGVLDGAQFDDLPRTLLDADVEHRPLYLDHGAGGRDRVLTAPQFVALSGDDPDEGETARQGRIDRLLAIVGDSPAAVFWSCPAGPSVLYRHLRTLNMVRLPREAMPDNPFAEDAAPADTHSVALFRHADANVLAQVLPALGERQVARLFGPATAILFCADPEWSEASGLFVAARPQGLPPANAGMLQLDDGNIAAIEAVRAEVFRRRAMNELGGGDPGRRAQVGAAFDRAGRYGLETKEDVWSFIALDLAHGPSFERTPRFGRVLERLEDSQLSPAARILCARDEAEALGTRSSA